MYDLQSRITADDDIAEIDVNQKCQPGFFLVGAAALIIWAIKSSLESTGEMIIKALMWSHRKKCIGVRSGDLRGQATGPPCPIQ
jgi:hypothetical protein